MLDKKITYEGSVLTVGGGTRLLSYNNEFVLELTITGSSQTITLPMDNSSTPAFVYNCTVNWGDGNSNVITSADDAGRIHVYNPGVYELSISGTYEKFWIWGGIDASNGDLNPIMKSITRILNWGFVGFKSINFRGCENLTSVSPNNGSYLSSLTSLTMEYLFYGCLKLASIPSDLFSQCTSQESFLYTFGGCKSLTSIPSGLFNLNVNCTKFEGVFAGCTKLTSIPSNLFDYCTGATSFKHSFAGCTGITSIPADLFKYNTEVTNFESVFNSVWDNSKTIMNITSIPTDLFRYNTKVTDFNHAFYGCNSLTSIPTDIFRYNTEVTTFASTFGKCNNITTIPTDLFRYNTKAVNFSQTFNAEEAGGKLTSIPETIFTYNTGITNLQFTFQKQVLLTGNAPTLWTSYPSADHTGCFAYCTGLTNYSSIPSDWK